MPFLKIQKFYFNQFCRGVLTYVIVTKMICVAKADLLLLVSFHYHKSFIKLKLQQESTCRQTADSRFLFSVLDSYLISNLTASAKKWPTWIGLLCVISLISSVSMKTYHSMKSDLRGTVSAPYLFSWSNATLSCSLLISRRFGLYHLSTRQGFRFFFSLLKRRSMLSDAVR